MTRGRARLFAHRDRVADPGARLRRRSAVSALLFAFGCGPPDAAERPTAEIAAREASAPGGAVCATILSTNDTHGRLLPSAYPWSEGRELGGVVAMDAHFDHVRAESPCPVFVFSGGDFMQGTPISNLSDGEATIAAFDLLGYDAAAIGNHEFDWGVEVLRERIGQAGFPILGANIFRRDTGEHPEWARPYAIVERDGVRIGVIGLTTRSTPTMTKPSNVVELRFGSIAEALDRYIPVVRSEGVDFVVVVMHAGGFCDRDATCEGEAMSELGRTSASWDYAVTGHTHSLVETEIRGIPVVQSLSNSTAFGMGRLQRTADGAVSADLLEVRRPYADLHSPDPEVEALVEQYWLAIADRAQRIVVTFAEPMRHFRDRGEEPLGRLITDAQRAATGTQVAMMNNGGIRRGFEAGPVTWEELFELHPFANRLVVLRLPGRQLLAALEHALGTAGRPAAHLSGLTVRYDPAKARGQRVVSAVLESGDNVRPDELYTVTVNDFMAEGGNGYVMFGEAESENLTDYVDLDVLDEYVSALPQPVPPPTEARWIAEGG